MDGFFPASVARATRPWESVLPECDRCGLYRAGCRSPKMPRTGDGRKRILVVGEAPGADEDAENAQFVGRTGRALQGHLRDLGIDLRNDCHLTNAVRCRPELNKLDRYPQAVDCCRPLAWRDVEETDPELILLLGGAAVRSIIPKLWRKDDVGPIARWAGTRIPAHRPNAWVVPTYHPSHVARQKEAGDVFTENEYLRHLRDAVSLVGTRPWPDGPPDYLSRVEAVMSPDEAAARLRKYTGGLIAFDFETTCLKPDAPDSRIVCASVCWEGQETIAFPWHGDARREMRRLLADQRVGKICQNATMELRWTWAKERVEVANVVFDTMLGAHALNPREKQKERDAGVTGLKFLAFAHLGQPIYNDHLDVFLASREDQKRVRGCYAHNRIAEIDTRQLLIYCSLDSLLEYELAMIFMRQLGLR